MRNRDSLLGRARPADRLTREQIAALDKATSTPAPTPAPMKPTAPPAAQEPKPSVAQPPPAGNAGANNGKNTTVGKSQLKFHWTVDCPEYGFKVSGHGDPSRGNTLQGGQHLARCGHCKVQIFLTGKATRATR